MGGVFRHQGELFGLKFFKSAVKAPGWRVSDEPDLFEVLMERRITIRSLLVLGLESTGEFRGGVHQSAVLISRA